MSGGGKIYKCFSLQQLITKCPTEQQLTHVFLDPWVLLPSDPRHQDFIRLRDYCLTRGLDIKFMSYKYLFMKIRQFPDLPNDCDYSIFNEKIQEMGMKEFESQKDSLKRPTRRSQPSWALRSISPSPPSPSCWPPSSRTPTRWSGPGCRTRRANTRARWTVSGK